MTDTARISVAKVLSSQISSDGQFVLLKVSQTTGDECELAIPRGTLLSVINHIALCKLQSDRSLKLESSFRESFKTSWWEMGYLPDRSLALALTFGLGGKLSFMLPGDIPAAMLEALQVFVTGRSAPAPPGRTN